MYNARTCTYAYTRHRQRLAHACMHRVLNRAAITYWVYSILQHQTELHITRIHSQGQITRCRDESHMHTHSNCSPYPSENQFFLGVEIYPVLGGGYGWVLRRGEIKHIIDAEPSRGLAKMTTTKALGVPRFTTQCTFGQHSLCKMVYNV